MKQRLFTFFTSLFACFMLMLSASAAVADTGYSDVAPDAWYAEAAAYCRDNGLMSGTSDTMFSPNATTSRGMLVTVLYRQAGSPAAAQEHSFVDVAAGAWHNSAVKWAASSGIVNGYADGHFGPDDPITREQLAVILWRSAGSPAPGLVDSFTDQSMISSYAADAVAWARNSGIISGRERNRFDPKATATRGELAVILYRWLEPETAEDPIPPIAVPTETEDANTMPQLNIETGGQTFTATLQDNPAVRAFLERLPMTVSMAELNGNEKYFYMSDSLPANSHRPGNIHAGDLMLYGSDCLVLFYESFSSGYSYTRLGSIDDPSGLSAALGGGSVDVTFQIISDG